MSASSLKSYAWLSIAAALATIVLKSLAWWLTGSVGLLSDALESVVNLAGAMMALAMISVAEAIGQGNFSQRLRLYPGREFDALARAINAMAENIETNIRTITTQKEQLEAILNGMRGSAGQCGLAGHFRAGAFLQHFLVPPLHAAITLAQCHGVAHLVCNDLDLHVMRPHDQLFQIDFIVAEEQLGFFL